MIDPRGPTARAEGEVTEATRQFLRRAARLPFPGASCLGTVSTPFRLPHARLRW